MERSKHIFCIPFFQTLLKLVVLRYYFSDIFLEKEGNLNGKIFSLAEFLPFKKKIIMKTITKLSLWSALYTLAVVLPFPSCQGCDMTHCSQMRIFVWFHFEIILYKKIILSLSYRPKPIVLYF